MFDLHNRMPQATDQGVFIWLNVLLTTVDCGGKRASQILEARFAADYLCTSSCKEKSKTHKGV